MYELSFCTFVIILQINYDERGDRYYARKNYVETPKFTGRNVPIDEIVKATGKSAAF